MSAEGGCLVAGVDLGGTNLQVGVVDQAGRIVADRRLRTRADEGEAAVVDRIVQGVGECCRGAGLEPGGLGAVGVVAPGAMDADGVVLDAPNLRWRNVPLRARLAARFPVPVAVENDVNGAVWGEHVLGAGRGRGDVLGVWVGTGVGGGLVLGGRVFRGDRCTAGEIGQTVIRPEGPAGRRTVEDLCSRSGLARLVDERLPDHPGSSLRPPEPGARLTMTRLAAAWAEGDALGRELLEQAADLLGVAIANWVTVLALDVVILGGGVTEALGERWCGRIRTRFREEVFPAEHRACEILATALRENAGLLGAALLARELVGESLES